MNGPLSSLQGKNSSREIRGEKVRVEKGKNKTLAETLLNTSMVGMIALKSDGKIVAYNRAAGEIFGHQPEAMIGKTLDPLFTSEAQAQQHQTYIQDFFSGKRQNALGQAMEIIARHASGKQIPVEITLSKSIVDEEIIVLAEVKDLSQNIETERRNKLLEEQLTQAQKMEALGTLAAGVAHDFNNMLGAIMGYASAMTRELEPTHRHFQDVSQILIVARQAKRLTNKLLVFSRRSDSKREPLSVNRVVRNVIGLLQRTIPKKIIFRTKLTKNNYTEGDRTQIEQMLLNICLNARDAMPDGGIIHINTSKVSYDDIAAKPLGLEAGEYVKLTIEDNGCGMDAETCSRVFNPFFSTKPKGEGSGLGLALVYNTIKSHQGSVRITSQPNKGTKVTLYLPYSMREPKPEQPTTTQEGPMRGKGETIMLVDDEKYLRDMAKRLLEGLGYKVMLAESGEEAEALYRRKSQSIDLVILDVMMVGLSGEETLDRLKEINSKVKVLVSSGFNREGEPRYLLRKGVSGFVQKPYGIEEVGLAIQKALQQ